MVKLFEKNIELQDAKYKTVANNSNETSIFISKADGELLRLLDDSSFEFFLNKENVLETLFRTFNYSVDRGVYVKQDKIKIDLSKVLKIVDILNGEYENFSYKVSTSVNGERFYLKQLKQPNGFNLREILIGGLYKLVFYRDDNNKVVCIIENKQQVFSELNFDEPIDFNEDLNVISDFATWLNSNSKNNYFDSDYDKTVKGLIAISEKYFESFGCDVFDIPSIEEEEEFKSTLLENIFKENTSFFEYSKQKSNHQPRAVLGASNYLKFIDEFYQQKKQIRLRQLTPQIDFTLNKFIVDIEASNLYFKPQLVTRFVASLITKPFVLLNGLSGSGKTKLAQAFVQWICQDESQYKIIPVGADWTNREPLLGYPDGLNPEVYVTPDNGALKLMLDAQKNEDLPYFMILDEMNLSHVERYFADFLSIMESDDSIKLYTGKNRKDSEGRDIPEIIDWPKNLFIIGTVNIDETTYMFSPKVLDRANVIEFRLSESELESFFKLTDTVNLETLVSEGASMSSNFLELAKSSVRISDENVEKEILSFFSNLSKVGAEFGYRTANEVLQLINQLGVLDINLSVEAKVDIAVMQKLLPKLHGSRSKLVKVLEALVKLCLDKSDDFEISKGEIGSTTIKYPLSYAKLMRMYHNVIANGFTSYAEA